MARRRFVVLDRDGTINVERHYLSDPSQVELIDGAARALRRLRGMGLGLIVITNQSGVARGYFDEQTLGAIHRRLQELLAEQEVFLDGIYVCPHLPDAGCACRKPGTALLERASKELGFDPRASFVIGDKRSDLELGRNVGASTFLVRTGYGADAAADTVAAADYVVDALPDAVPIIWQSLAADERSLANAPIR